MDNRIKLSLTTFLPALFFSLFTAVVFLTFRNAELDYYTQVGSSVVYGVDYQIRTSTLIFAGILTAALTILFSFLFNRLFKSINTNYLRIIDIVSGLSLVSLIYRMMNSTSNYFYNSYTFYKQLIFDTEISLLFFILLFLILGIFIIRDEKKVLASILSAFISYIVLEEVVYCLFGWYPVLYLGTALFMYLFMIAFGLLYFFISKELISKIIIFLIVMAIGGILSTFYLEYILVLNVQNIIVGNTISGLLILYLVFVILGIILMFTKRNTNEIPTKALVIATTLLVLFKSFQPEFSYYIGSTDFYEMANPGNTIYGFLEYRKLPILETFDAHMIGSDVFQIIYGLLSKDYYVASTTMIYTNAYMFLITYLILFVFLSLFIDEFSAFLIVVFYPYSMIENGIGWTFGLIVPLAFIKMLKNKNTLTIILFPITVLTCILYRLDIGYMYGISAIILYFGVLIYWAIKDRKLFIKAIIIDISFVIILAVTLLVILKLKSIPVIPRIKEFMGLVNSNYRWALVGIGNTNSYGYVIINVLLPIFVILSYGYYIYKNHKKEDIFTLIVLSMLLLAFILNLSRGYVRHSLQEGVYGYILGTGGLLVALVFSLKNNKLRGGLFTIVLFGLIVSLETITNNSVDNSSAVMQKATSIDREKYESYDYKIDRVSFSNQSSVNINRMKMLSDNLLGDQETYISLSWDGAGYYAFLEKDCPTYANQSTGILSTKDTELYMINQWDSSNIGVVITDYNCKHVDDVCSKYQFSEVYNYLYKNYTLCWSYDKTYYVWFRNTDIIKYNSRVFEGKSEFSKLMSEVKSINSDYVNLGLIPAMIEESENLNLSTKIAIFKGSVNNPLKSAVCDFSGLTMDEFYYYKIHIENPKNAKINTLTLKYTSKYDIESVDYISFVEKKNVYDYYIPISNTILWNECKATGISWNKECQPTGIELMT